ncbi:hypothetical protein TUM4261_30300 [Shewanella sp. c952]|nr:hypothetical protein TUM4261_30300 [Shewanella sp. c952]
MDLVLQNTQAIVAEQQRVKLEKNKEDELAKYCAMVMYKDYRCK